MSALAAAAAKRLILESSTDEILAMVNSGQTCPAPPPGLREVLRTSKG